MRNWVKVNISSGATEHVIDVNSGLEVRLVNGRLDLLWPGKTYWLNVHDPEEGQVGFQRVIQALELTGTIA